MKKNILFLFLFLSFSIVAQEKTRFNKIDSLLTYLYDNNKFMGAVSLQENGNTVFEKNYGFADVENNIPADADTKYRIGSITKTFTASIIFQLIEEKKLTLETKLSKFYSEIPNAGSITIGMMLNHKSGIANYTDNTFQTYKTKPQTKRDMLKRIAALQPTFEPDTRAEYSNSNYLLLGYIIESITGKNYGDNVATRITNKIGLKNTYYPKKGAPGKNEAFSYSFSNNKWNRTDSWDLSVANAAGALVSTASDLTTFINALFTGKIIKPASLAQMTTVEKGYGKGLLQFPFSDKRFLGHNGIIEDFRSMVAYHPSDKIAVSLIVNGNNYNENEILMGILSIYYKIPYRFPNLKTVAVDQKLLKSYEGVYSSKQVPLQLTIKLENGELTGQATGQGAFPLKALSPTEFTFDAAGIEITFKNNGLLLKQGDSKLNFSKE
ncbi:serine hydrolase domain-containing protein [Flavobacterium cerinum]|uniref:Beta-lactamase family protein n=1 Tax=Flavobacterium cerinum TaxID=2502784 RepID=A0ABY5IYS1_9FLAO|nr:serine hydrolase domain-containing protein [Flavobacterium cerinum]UUC46641.1 beta-lactamase family protein [Flavobacterium cerinum]